MLAASFRPKVQRATNIAAYLKQYSVLLRIIVWFEELFCVFEKYAWDQQIEPTCSTLHIDPFILSDEQTSA